MPVPPVAEAADALGRPRDDVRCPHRDLLLATRAQVRPGGPGATDPAHGPERTGIPLGRRLTESAGCERAVLVAAAVGAGHTDDCPVLSSASAGRWRRW